MAEIKQIAQRATQKQINNLAEGERLLKTTQEMNNLAEEFKKQSYQMEQVQKSNSWWLCSKGCIAVFVGAPLALFLLILIATWAICGSPFCMGD